MGRTGKLFAFEHFDIVPDIITLAKAFGGGLPLGAFVASPERMQALSHNPVLGHITTFGGNAIACAAGLAAFEYLTETRLYESVEEKAEQFKSLLVHERIREIRNKGLLMALDLEDPVYCKRVIDLCLAKGLFLDWFLFAAHCIRIAPPLIIESEDIQKACKIILESLDEAAD